MIWLPKKDLNNDNINRHASMAMGYAMGLSLIYRTVENKWLLREGELVISRDGFPVLSSPHWNHIHSRKNKLTQYIVFISMHLYVIIIIDIVILRPGFWEGEGTWKIVGGRKEREKTYLHFNLKCIIWSLLVCEAIIINHGEAVFTLEQRFHAQCRKGIPGNPLVPPSVVFVAWLWPLNHLQVRKKNRNCGKKDIKKIERKRKRKRNVYRRFYSCTHEHTQQKIN